MRLNRFHKTLLKMAAFVVFLFVWAAFLIFPPPWKSWSIDDPTKVQTQQLRMYFFHVSSNYSDWCGNLKYTNDMDCEFRLVVTNPKSDTLYNRIIKAPKISKYEKDLEFGIRHSKDISIHFIPVKVPKNAKISFYFKNYFDCVD
ncbi:hypothetical protein GVN16_10090 [Emticicia sp. CRIBPO]|uniref:hypothetical protein n=1 Tax=Emticicia sp. CRIBPO TaxID=2683258 RepID=UPI00141373AA|nr:hypothetical protein [Emticicia sp. CRIBPO]NBA86111.1 hypothetical protein [Emticicia sp. CRIBPO]